MFATPTPFDQNLILTGYIGPGQWQIARRTAEYLRIKFVDFEQRVETVAEMPGDEVRALFGEARLKTVEEQLLAEMSLYRGTLIHISGQALMRGGLERLRPTGPVLCLVARLDFVLRRLHLAMGARYHDPRERDLAYGVINREWAIRNQAGITQLDVSTLSETQMVQALADRWREQAAVIDWRSA